MHQRRRRLTRTTTSHGREKWPKRNWPAFTRALSGRKPSADLKRRPIRSVKLSCDWHGKRSCRDLKSLQHRKRTDSPRSIGLRRNMGKSMTRNCDPGLKKSSRSKTRGDCATGGGGSPNGYRQDVWSASHYDRPIAGLTIGQRATCAMARISPVGAIAAIRSAARFKCEALSSGLIASMAFRAASISAENS
jgi:hypothetical protein